jgi:hypothetical protein
LSEDAPHYPPVFFVHHDRAHYIPFRLRENKAVQLMQAAKTQKSYALSLVASLIKNYLIRQGWMTAKEWEDAQIAETTKEVVVEELSSSSSAVSLETKCSVLRTASATATASELPPQPQGEEKQQMN